MATLTITKSADNSLVGKDWTAYDARKRNCTYIFDELWGVIRNNPNLTFDELHALVKKTYEETTTKSRCGIYKSDNYFDICRPNKSMPDIWIVKKE